MRANGVKQLPEDLLMPIRLESDSITSFSQFLVPRDHLGFYEVGSALT